MNFTSAVFFPFFAAVFVLYYLPLLRKHQIWVLLAASIYFYAHETPELLLLLFTSCIISTAASYLILRAPEHSRRTRIAACGVVLNLGLLAFFKYKFLFIGYQPFDSKGSASMLQILLSLPLPIGISFYTFHGISLLVDSIRRQDKFFLGYDTDLFQHTKKTFLYLVFFPQLIAGPIVKAKDFFPQIGPKALREINWGYVASTLITGYFLKSVVADNLQDQTSFMQAPYFLAASAPNLMALLFGYSMQIFADFAGYSLIALGLAALLGYRLPQNFNFPYVAQSVSDFWRRWHISLSSWLRDYLYVPLGGNRYGEVRTYVNLIIVMFLGGLWHGAAWSYAIWGLWHGIGLAIERPFLKTLFYVSQHRLVAAARIFGVGLFATLGWLLFKLPNFSEAASYANAMLHNWTLPVNAPQLAMIGLYSIPVLSYHALYLSGFRYSHKLSPYLLGAMLFLIASNSGREAAFIYFQF
ncbi:MAG TPA: MBOAT family O-acyltransferase [Nevskia sp.]|nr:MBOAT family O-acyltransferase [Nevskia sp.]